MNGADLLRLYPRAWRERYGDECLAVVGDRRLGFQQVIEILSGAIDAWLSSDVRRAVQPQGVSYHSGGSTMLEAICADSNVRVLEARFFDWRGRAPGSWWAA